MVSAALKTEVGNHTGSGIYPGGTESISHYARRHEGEPFMIDDITRNDLQMDEIFIRMNNTHFVSAEKMSLIRCCASHRCIGKCLRRENG